ncbi:MAG TPA: beta-propeller fold lactonase family protein [Streptosporangiaceae bacterium]|jgi:YVTN family beta-propeller protein
MSLSESGSRPAWASRRVLTAGTAAVAVAAAAVTGVAIATHSASGHPGASHARLAASACTGPTGAAYIALPGFQAFDAVNTANCDLIQQYNVGDRDVPGTGTSDTNFDSSDEGIAMSGSTLYFANTGNNTVAVMDSAALQVSNFDNPAETLINVGQDPEYVAVTPDGSQVWVADTGPQSGVPTLGAISIISTATNTVTATIQLPSVDPRQIAFAPSGATAYVTTRAGVDVISTRSRRVSTVIPGGNPNGIAISPDGKTVYVTNDVQNVVDVIKTANNKITGRIKVGELPWALTLSSDGSTLYSANGDSDSISVINTAAGTVTGTMSDPGDPVSLALTPDGSELWVGGLTSGVVTVFKTSDKSLVGSFNVGFGGEANAGDGEEPTGIVTTTTPTPGS